MDRWVILNLFLAISPMGYLVATGHWIVLLPLACSLIVALIAYDTYKQ